MWFKDFQDGCRGPSWLSEQNNFSKSKSACPLDASLQVLEQFQDGHHGGHLEYHNAKISAIMTLHVAPMPPTKFHLNLTYDSEEDVKNVKS